MGALGRLRRRGRGRPEAVRIGSDLDPAEVSRLLTARPDTLVVHADGLRPLAELAAAVSGCTDVRRITVVVVDHGPRGRLGAAPRWGLRDIGAGQVRRRDGVLEVDLRLRRASDLGVVLVAVVRALAPVAGRPSLGRAEVRAVTDQVWSADWLPAVDGPAVPALVEGVLRSTDVLLAPLGTGEAAGSPVVVDPTGSACLLVPWIHRAAGRDEQPQGRGVLDVDGDRLVLDLTGERRALGGDGLDEAAVARLRSVAAVSVSPTAATHRDLHRVLVQVSATGVAVGHRGAAATVDESLSASWNRVAELTDEWAIELESAVQLRAAHRHHAIGARVLLGEVPTVSVVMSTNRDESLEHALGRLASLVYPRLECVLGLHGTSATAAQVDARWAAMGSPYPLTALELAADRPLGEVLATITARAAGSLVTKMDDDDWYAAEHIWDLVLAREASGADVVGKAAEFVHVVADDTTVRRVGVGAHRYGGFVAGGTILVARADLEAVGGWRPVARSVDRALLERLERAGGRAYRTGSLGYLYVRRTSGHTWAVDDEHFVAGARTSWPGLLRIPEFGTA